MGIRTGVAVLLMLCVQLPGRADPTMAITEPEDGALFVAPAAIPLTASVEADPSLEITQVVFYADTLPIAVVPSEPWSADWQDVPAGSYAITAAAWDSDGIAATSTPISVTVNPHEAPGVGITDPADGAIIPGPAYVVVRAVADAQPGLAITQITVCVDGTPIGSGDTSPCEADWLDVPDGQYELTARAWDDLGAGATSAPVAVAVVTPPALLVEPESQTVDPGVPVSFQVEAAGTPPLAYRWQINGLPLAGATGAQHRITAATERDEGAYRCIVTNRAGAVTSETATLEVNDLPPTPTGLTAGAGTSRDLIRVAWNPAAGAYGYLLYRSLDSATSGAALLSEQIETTFDDIAAERGVRYVYRVRAQNEFGLLSPFSAPAIGWRRSAADTPVADYDGDGLADPAQYYPDAAAFSMVLSGNGYEADGRTGVGGPGFAAASADYDGDRLGDPAAYEEESGTWTVMVSGSDNEVQTIPRLLGNPGRGPAPADYDGDGRADPAVYHEASGTWAVLFSSAGYGAAAFPGLLGGVGFSPAPADYDGDGRADPAVYAEATGNWEVRFSSGNYARFAWAGLLGQPGYTAVPADYDGDGLADPAVHHETTGEWRVLLSSLGYRLVVVPLAF